MLTARAAAGPDVVLAHAALLHALPFVVPAFLVVALLGVIIWRDRHSEDPDEPEDDLPRDATD